MGCTRCAGGSTYVTPCSLGASGDSGRAGFGLDARGRLHVLCPTCRRAVTAELELLASSGGRTGSEQYEQLAVPGSEPGDPPTYIPRVPRVAFPEHVDREDGRLRAPALGAGTGTGGRGTGLLGHPVRAAHLPRRPGQGFPRRHRAIGASPLL